MRAEPILFACAVVFLSRVASAEPPPKGEMVIQLTGGKQFRGSIVEIAPGKHYVVARADGITLKIPWSAVRTVSTPNGPPLFEPEPSVDEKKPEPEVEGPPPPPPAPMRQSTGPTALVEIQSKKRIQLQWSERGSGRWETACMSPCNTALPVDGLYRIVDDNGRPGKPFEIEHDGKVTIQAIPRSTAMDAIGIVALAGGTVSLYGGALAADKARSNDSAPAVAVLFGLSAMLVGTILLLVNDSSVQIDQGSSSQARPPPPRSFWKADAANLTFRF